jgi:hypothetical protein
LLLKYISKASDKGGKIIASERDSYPVGPVYTTQENAWMSEDLMMMWIEQCLAPYVMMAPDGIIPLLFLDSYCVHRMGSVNRAINNLGIEVIILPPNCTSITKPVDIGYNKPFKELVRDKYQNWMVTESNDLTKAPRHVDVARWIVEAEREMKPSTLQKSWMRMPMEYFPQIDLAVPEVVHVEAILDGAPVISDMEEDK